MGRLAVHVQDILDSLPPPDVNVIPWLMVYLYISIAGAFSILAYISLGYYASLQASRYLFLSMLQRLSRAPARFFDVTQLPRCKKWSKEACLDQYDAINCGAATSWCGEQITAPFTATGKAMRLYPWHHYAA